MLFFVNISYSGNLSVGMICFFRDKIPGNTSISVSTVTLNEVAITFDTNLLYVKAVASSLKISIQKVLR